MDLATIIGLVACLGLMIMGIITGRDGVAAIGNFLHLQSALITFGGAFGSTLISNKLGDFLNGLKGFIIALKQKKMDQTEQIKKIIELSNVARKEGILALEDAAAELEDEFMKKGILLIVDGTEPDLVRAILETELSCVEQRHKKVITVWETLAAMGPAWGMIGTLIGLINMLKGMDVTSSDSAATLGLSMSTALITTFYGCIVAHLFCGPIGNLCKYNHNQEILCLQIIEEGTLAITAGANPRYVEEKLRMMLPAKADKPKGKAAASSDSE